MTPEQREVLTRLRAEIEQHFTSEIRAAVPSWYDFHSECGHLLVAKDEGGAS